jgi:hypothetical protein
VLQILVLSVAVMLLLALNHHGHGPFMPKATLSIIQEFDLELTKWREGKEIQLHHPLFQLKKVSGIHADTIVFEGETSGEKGIVFLQFYTLSGRPIFLSPSKQRVAHVDRKKRRFALASAIPAELIGKAGAVQVTFQGKERASFLLKLSF